jgi:hypothetical protein
MTIYTITSRGEDYCIGCAHTLAHTKNIDLDVIWELVYYNSDPEAYFLRIVEELKNMELIDKNTRFKFNMMASSGNQRPVQLIDGQRDDLEGDTVEIRY